MHLVLAEKPSVARDLAKVIDPGARRGDGCLEGRRYTWTWAVGHLAELAPPEHYQPDLKGRWRLDLLPVLPARWVLQPRAGRTDQLAVVRRLLKAAESVVVATDAGREGELIWENIREVCGYEGPWQRLWLSETTAPAVKAAFQSLLPAQAKAELASAARARSQADWLVGMNATMALSARHGGLWSAGRVQTPTLALLTAREGEIRAFHPEPYFVVLARFRSEAKEYGGRWFTGDQDRLPDQKAAHTIAKRVAGHTGRIAELKRKQTREQPPRLMNLTDLQRAANARHGLTAAATLKIAQTLYEEKKVLTYPRTDSRHVSRETFATFPARLRAVGGDLALQLAANLPDPGKRVVDDAQVSDHHALLPTDRRAELNEAERKVYDLVAQRLVVALLPPAVWAETEAVTEVEGETFRSKSRNLRVPGWRAVEPPAKADDDEPGDGELASLRQGAPSTCLEAKVDARKTKAPPRYTEATLLRAMEHAGRLVDEQALADAMKERGLGTPATRAAIIETLVRREYVAREKKALVPTARGLALVERAPAALRSVETTGEWEQRLRRIERGQEQAAGFLRAIAELTRGIVAEVVGQSRAAVPPAAKAAIGSCPVCGGDVVEYPRAFNCLNRSCRFIIWKKVAGKALTAGQVRELLARGETRRPVKGFKSKAGRKFEARLRLERATGRVSFVFEAPAAAGPGNAPSPSGRGTAKSAGVPRQG